MSTDTKLPPAEQDGDAGVCGHVSDTILSADVVETPFQFEQMLSRNVNEYGRFFKDHQEYVDFMSLPIRPDQRASLLVVMSQDAKAEREKRAFGPTMKRKPVSGLDQ